MLFTDCYCTQFRRVSQALTKLYDAALKDQGILLTQFSLLRALERMGSATHSELAEEVVLDKTTISRNVKVLDNAGWVTFEPMDDRRQKKISLSDAGHTKLRAATESWRRAQSEVLTSAKAMFSLGGTDPLIDTLEKLQALTGGPSAANHEAPSSGEDC